MRTRRPSQQPKTKLDPRRTPPQDDELIRELKKLGPRKPPKRVVPR